MRRLGVVAMVLVLTAAACSDGGGEEAAPTTAPTSAPSTTAAPSTSSTLAPVTTAPAPATSTTAAPTAAATAVVEPDTIAGIEMGSNRSTAYAVLGQPSATGQETDLGGERYDFARWDLAGNRGLTLVFRSPGVTGPQLTHWHVTAPGPATALGIEVGDPAGSVVAAYGALTAFCCGTEVASVSRGGGRLIVVVEPGGNVRSIYGGAESSWSRVIAD